MLLRFCRQTRIPCYESLIFFLKFFLYIIRQSKSTEMYPGIIITILQPKFRPAFKVSIFHWVKTFRGKPEQPVSGRIGRHIKLINCRYGKYRSKFFMCTAHFISIFFIVRRFVLIDQDTLIIQRPVAIAVKLGRKKTFARSKRICRIDEYQIICTLRRVLYEFNPSPKSD